MPRKSKRAPIPVAPEPAPVPAPTGELAQELAKIEADDARLAYPVFLGNRQQFIERLGAFMPKLAERTINYLTAHPVHQMAPNGTLVRTVPEAVDMSDGQIALTRLLLGKLVPATTQIDPQGNDPAKRGPRKVMVTINQVGNTMNPEQMSKATINGVMGAEATQVNKIRIKRPPTLDVTPEKEPEA